MDDYRIYLLDGAGRIISGTDRQCMSDDEASAAARALAGEWGEAEVWQGVRCVGRVSATLPQGWQCIDRDAACPADEHDVLTWPAYSSGVEQ